MLYEFTITLVPFLYSRTAVEQKQAVDGRLKEILSRFQASGVYELTSVHNVHAHLMIDFKDHRHRDKFINQLRPLKKGVIGKCSCSQLVHQTKWEEYMRKDMQETRDLIGDPIIKDDFCCLCDPRYRFQAEYYKQTPGSSLPISVPGYRLALPMGDPQKTYPTGVF